MSLTTDATDDQPDDAGADDADDGDQVPALPTDQELAEYFRETWDSDGQPVTWVEYFGFKDIDGKPRRDLDDRVREFMMDHIGPQPE